MILSAMARISGVIGWPVTHSRSPRLHGYWLQKYGIDGAYIAMPVRPVDLPTAIRALPALGFRGANVTVPHKEAALALCDEVDEMARRIGAVNTLVVRNDGRLVGANSDAYGFLENLRQASDWRAAAGPAVILGAGGAARAVGIALLDAGVPALKIVNRTAERAQTLARNLGRRATAVAWEKRSAALDEASLLVNTTSLGMTGQPALEIDLQKLPAAATVNDIVYSPLETPLLAAARARGNAVVDGIGMLLHQARPGFEAWYGRRPEVDEALRRFVLGDTP